MSAHGLHYGTGVFEGIRCYNTADGPAVFRLDAHLGRMFGSARTYGLPIPYSQEELTQGCDRRYQRQRILGLLRAPYCDLRQRKPGSASAELPGGSRHAGVAVGSVPRRRRAGEWHPGNGLTLEEVQFTGHAGDGKSLRAIPELNAGGAGCSTLRLRRSTAGGRRGSHRRRFGRELLHGAERQRADQRRARPRAHGNHSRLGDHAGARSGIQGLRRPDAFGRTGSCGRGIFHRYCSRSHADQCGGSQADRKRQAGTSHVGVAACVSLPQLQGAIRSTKIG